MSSIVGRMVGAVSSWTLGPLSGVYRLILPGLLSIFGEATRTLRSEVKLSLVAPPEYFPRIVKESFESMRFLHGKKIPLKVKVVTREASRSLRYGLVRSDHFLQVSGEKRYTDELLARIRESTKADRPGSGLTDPRVSAPGTEGWLESTGVSNAALVQNQVADSGISLKSIGIIGALVAVVAALAYFSGGKRLEQDPMGNAVSHLRKRGIEQLQLLRSERVEGGEKFYFQGAKENYTVVVAKDGRVYSWSRNPAGNGASGLR